jgi:glucose-6-phosphate dehydrogenase assembly protein OpcA
MTTTPPPDVTADRAAALPVAATTWETHTVDAKTIQQALDYLWAEVGQDSSNPDATGAPKSFDQASMRASTVNLIVLCDSVENAREIGDLVGHLTEFCPSRTVILVTDGPRQDVDALTVRAAVYQRPIGRGRPPVTYETVTVMANSKRASSLANIASTLLIPELPDFLWWHARKLERHPLFDELADICDRLIVDTTSLDLSADTIRLLARLASLRQSELRLSDLTWARLTPWRQLVAQFFDNPAAQASIDLIDELTISFSENSDLDATGLSSALLVAGWFATRLGWHAPGELVRSGTGWRLTLRAGAKGSQREIVLRLHPEPSSSPGSLIRMNICASPNDACTLSVERASAAELLTTSVFRERPPMSRLTYMRPLDPAALLSDELRMFGRDVVFEEAMIFAARLLPEGVAV